MSNCQDKWNLILEACQAVTEMESRGGLMKEHHPKIVLQISQYDDELLQSEILLIFPDGKVGEPANWSGMGKTMDESLDSNILCLFFELRDRVGKLNRVMEKLRAPVHAAYPDMAEKDKKVIAPIEPTPLDYVHPRD